MWPFRVPTRLGPHPEQTLNQKLCLPLLDTLGWAQAGGWEEMAEEP